MSGEDVYDMVDEPEEWERPETTWTNLLVVLSVPNMEIGGELPDADEIADGFVRIINEEWRRNSEHVPDYFRPVRINAIPSPQWLSGPSMKILVDAVRILHYAQEHAAALGADPDPEDER